MDLRSLSSSDFASHVMLQKYQVSEGRHLPFISESVPANYTFDNYTGYYYKAGPEIDTYSNAVAACALDGARLAMATDSVTEAVIRATVASLVISLFTPTWLECFDPTDDGKWTCPQYSCESMVVLCILQSSEFCQE